MRALLIIAFAAALGAQTFPQGPDTTPRYQANQTVSLSGTAAAVTVQQQAAGNGRHSVTFEAGWVYCSVACSFTITQNCATAATTTAGTIALLNNSPPSSVNFYTASNVGGTCGYTSNAYQVSAGSTFVLDLSKMYLTQGSGNTQNLTFTTSSITGTAEITIQWVER